MGLVLESTSTEILCGLLVLFWILFTNFTQEYNHWKDRNIPYVKPVFPFGSIMDFFRGKINMGGLLQIYYKQFKDERYFGIYETRTPTLVVRDPELIKSILIKDFQSFSDRVHLPINKKYDYISNHLFNMSGQDWKKMRSKLTPTFTSGKMKMMFQLMLKCSQQLKVQVEKHVKDGPKTIEVKDFLARFTMDIIASCAFGLEINTQSDKNCEFYYYGLKIFQPLRLGLLKRIIFSFLPFLHRIFVQRFSDAEVSEFLTRIVKQTVEYRENNDFNRNDFLDLLIKIRQNKNLHEDGEESHVIKAEMDQNKSADKKGLTIEEMTAQAFIFFAAGFETASSTMTFCLYELACHPEVQERLHEEIKAVLTNYGGKPTYQALQEMTYMDQVINETLRRYASVSFLTRTCTETYQVPNSDLVLEKGARVSIPVYAIHHDPEHYPEPYKFNPERFSSERMKERHPYVHLPFGEGPRMCIGMRFGLLQTKLGLTEMVSNFEFGLTSETQVPISIHKRSFITQPEKPILLQVKKRLEC